MNRKFEIEHPAEKLTHDLKEVVRDGEALLRLGARRLDEKGTEARKRLGTALMAARKAGRKMQMRTVLAAKATDRFVRSKPYHFMGIAFGTGVILGVLAHRKAGRVATPTL